MIQGILTDIEGTTSSIQFVYQVLFPYARKALPSFLSEHFKESWMQALLQKLWQEELHKSSQEKLDLASILALLLHWMDEDRKHPLLKDLQGRIWRSGYTQGQFFGHVYQDAYQVLQKWHQQKLTLAIYSSGSMEAQKLLFQHSDFGDLTPLFSGYFDRSSGAKTERESYHRIAQDLGIQETKLLFLSDRYEELDAARAAGYLTYQLARDSACQLGSHRVAQNFFEVEIVERKS